MAVGFVRHLSSDRWRMMLTPTRLPQDSEARTLIVGYSIAGVYAILSWSQVLIWPASEAPYC